jgi:MIP family channel proteins
VADRRRAGTGRKAGDGRPAGAARPTGGANAPSGAVRASTRRAAERSRRRPSRRAVGAGAPLAEALGTFILLFFGVGTILAVGGAGAADQKIAIALAFGLSILAAAYAFGHVSGAHLNPAVTIAQVVSGRLPAPAAVPYIVAQVVGGLLGALAARIAFGESVALSATQPGAVGTGGAFLAEVVLGFILMLVVKGTAVDDRSEGPAAGMAIGLTIAAGHLAMIPVSGASFNPARSIASAVVGGELSGLWIYLIAPVIGAVMAALVYENVLRTASPPDEPG